MVGRECDSACQKEHSLRFGVEFSTSKSQGKAGWRIAGVALPPCDCFRGGLAVVQAPRWEDVDVNLVAQFVGEEEEGEGYVWCVFPGGCGWLCRRELDSSARRAEGGGVHLLHFTMFDGQWTI